MLTSMFMMCGNESLVGGKQQFNLTSKGDDGDGSNKVIQLNSINPISQYGLSALIRSSSCLLVPVSTRLLEDLFPNIFQHKCIDQFCLCTRNVTSWLYPLLQSTNWHSKKLLGL